MSVSKLFLEESDLYKRILSNLSKAYDKNYSYDANTTYDNDYVKTIGGYGTKEYTAYMKAIYINYTKSKIKNLTLDFYPSMGSKWIKSHINNIRGAISGTDLSLSQQEIESVRGDLEKLYDDTYNKTKKLEPKRTLGIPEPKPISKPEPKPSPIFNPTDKKSFTKIMSKLDDTYKSNLKHIGSRFRQNLTSEEYYLNRKKELKKKYLDARSKEIGKHFKSTPPANSTTGLPETPETPVINIETKKTLTLAQKLLKGLSGIFPNRYSADYAHVKQRFDKIVKYGTTAAFILAVSYLSYALYSYYKNHKKDKKLASEKTIKLLKSKLSKCKDTDDKEKCKQRIQKMMRKYRDK